MMTIIECRDGSHRTIGCTPTTTCGELLDQILSKLGLVEQQEEYGLQIKYKYAGKYTVLLSCMNQHKKIYPSIIY